MAKNMAKSKKYGICHIYMVIWQPWSGEETTGDFIRIWFVQVSIKNRCKCANGRTTFIDKKMHSPFPSQVPPSPSIQSIGQQIWMNHFLFSSPIGKNPSHSILFCCTGKFNRKWLLLPQISIFSSFLAAFPLEWWVC
jgi:hypothetical protein